MHIVKFKFVVFLCVTFFSTFSYSADCVTQRTSYFDTTYSAELVSITIDNTDLDTCNESVILSAAEYSNLSSGTTARFITHTEFLIMLPYLIGSLLTAKLFRVILQQFFNWY